MAIKERLLKRLFTINDRLEQATDVSERTTKNFLLQQLTDVRDKCQDGLPKGFYGEYAKIYDGLILAVKQIVKTESQNEQKEIQALIAEILRNLILQTNNEKHFKKEFVFLPYKFSMWDSLESVWRAAYEDSEHCKTYVIPIPYADFTSDGNIAGWHCEIGCFPKDIPTLNWQDFDLKEMRPDAIFIHNPYDNRNSVTSVDERYYSYNLKPCTDCLIYVPYYATSGGMAESQSDCSAYKHVDYIVTQSEKFRKFFDASLPDEKFLPLGSPKFDKTIGLCKNPPKPPVKWEKKLQGKKVFFYNTSIGGLLGDTPNFLKKMQYVFDTFKQRKDVCLLWRPHPLLESTIRSMRPEYKRKFEKLRDSFIHEDFGIYDTTPDIEKTIALCDAYVGDGATSVTSLFGVAGKPVFYLNNRIHHLPIAGDWLGSVNRVWGFLPREWMLVYGNQLWRDKDKNFHFHHSCDLSEYSGGGYYGTLLELDGKLYVTPNNAQDILVVEDGKISRKIQLERRIERVGAFSGATYFYKGNEDYFFLLPLRYPAVVRYDFRNDRIDYVECPNELFSPMAMDEFWRGAVFFYEDWLVFGSPIDNRAFAINRHTMESKLITLCNDQFQGSMFVMQRRWGDGVFYFVPYVGKKITRWNVETGEVREYALPENFKCYHPIRGYENEIRPFVNGIFKDDDTILLAPLWGNMFVKLHIDTGEVEEWKTPFEITPEGKNEYFYAGSPGFFIAEPDMETYGLPKSYQFYYTPTRTRYNFNPETEEFTPIEHDAVIDEEEMRAHIPGFCEMSEFSVYGCWEDVFNTLADFVDDNISGQPFNKERQLKAYETVAANIDGTAGEKIYRFAMEKTKVLGD